MRSFKKYFLCLMAAGLLFSCKKEDKHNVTADRSTLNFLVRDNFTLGFLAVALNRTGLEKELAQLGPYTLLAPSDDAFKNAGYNTQADVYDAANAEFTVRSRYHILPGRQSLLALPLGLNQTLKTITNTEVFVSRVIKDNDTLTTVNGSRVMRVDSRASNGLLQLIDRLLVPNVFQNLGDALAADINLSLFYHAIKQSGLIADLNGTDTYTVYALTNAAMRTEGYADIAAIDAADPATLRSMLSYHIAAGRRFAQDYFLLTTSGATTYTETMLDNRTLAVTLHTQRNVPNSFTGISLHGLANTTVITPQYTDILTGNGVIHVLPRALK